GNWIGAPDQSAPISGVDNVLFDTAVSTANNLVINTPFTIADGRSMEAIGSSGTHVVRLASTLTVETGGTLDFSTGGNHVFAESGAATARLTIEPDATVDFWRLFSGDGWTFEFI
ncbi:MAG: hypothetical protein GTO26_02025, partial [Planctomycetales bacterium]|nr:hypothetical protein [Planctomycetales bacterium]